MGFNPQEECEKCKQQIRDNLSTEIPNVLVTHCVPHKQLNAWEVIEPHGIFNQYSGCADFLKELPGVKVAICGHTHKQVMAALDGVACYNIGNDYMGRAPLRYEVIEI